MPANVAIMVVCIVAIVTFGRIYAARHGLQRMGRNSYVPIELPHDDSEARALRDEVKMLRDRIHVLERIATDGNSAARIDEEIARLRDR